MMQYRYLCRSFSTGTTGLVKEQPPTATLETTTKVAAAGGDLPVDKEGNVLVSAAKEAQRLSDLASKRRQNQQAQIIVDPAPPITQETETASTAAVEKINRIVTEETLQNALDAAQALLFVTNRSTPLQDAIRQKQKAEPDVQNQINSLHRAFIAVTSWCLDVAAVSHDPRILDKALEIAGRSYKLNLPLHLPLYQRLLRTVAQEYDPQQSNIASTYIANGRNRNYRRTTLVGILLELASRVTISLSTDATSSSDFFRDSLVALAERGRFGDIVALLLGMEHQFSIYDLEMDTLAHLLAVLQEKVEENEDLATGSGENWEQTVELIEVLNLLNPYVWKSMKHYTSLTNLTASRISRSKEERNQQESDNIEALVEQIIPTTPSYHQDETDDADSGKSKKKSTKRRRSARKKYDEMYHYRRLIYHPVEGEFDRLPDLTKQIESLLEGRRFRYSQEMEKSILNRVMDEEADMFDADYGSEDMSDSDADQIVDMLTAMGDVEEVDGDEDDFTDAEYDGESDYYSETEDEDGDDSDDDR